MEEKTHEAVCAHEPCGCRVAEFAKYCSDWCETALLTTDCGCGHVDCRAIAVAGGWPSS